MSRQQRRIPSRPSTYLGCEGSSEVGYGQRILDLVGDAGLHIQIETDNLGSRGGAPRPRLEIAIKRIRKKESHRGVFRHKAILMDFDQVERNEQEFDLVNRLAQDTNIRIIWQRPSHEALLLRHLRGCAGLRPPTTLLAQARLEKEWPEYKKPMNRVKLAHRIGIVELCQAAKVEPELAAFLNAIGFT